MWVEAHAFPRHAASLLDAVASPSTAAGL
jgi:hypothetical protein